MSQGTKIKRVACIHLQRFVLKIQNLRTALNYFDLEVAVDHVLQDEKAVKAPKVMGNYRGATILLREQPLAKLLCDVTGHGRALWWKNNFTPIPCFGNHEIWQISFDWINKSLKIEENELRFVTDRRRRHWLNATHVISLLDKLLTYFAKDLAAHIDCVLLSPQK